ncbi:MAG: flagellin [Deferrisomatales bacterium]
MSLSVNNNITALNAWGNLKKTDFMMSKSMEKLSSGLRINRAADDPAGLVISEKMRAQLAGLDAAVKNSEKAINMIATAESALDQVQKLLDKMRQLALDSANSGVNDAASLQANQDELDEAIASITRIADYTQFGTKKLLNGTLGTNFTADTSDTLGAKISAASFKGITDTDKAGTVTLQITDQAEQASVTLTLGGKAISATNEVLIRSVAFTLNGVTISAASGTAMDDLARTINGYSDTTGVTATWSSTNDVLVLKSDDYGSEKYVTLSNTVGTYSTGTALYSVAAATDYGVDYQATATYADGNTTTFDQGKGLTLIDSLGNTIVLSTGTIASGTTTYDVGTLSVNQAKFQVGANENQTVTVSVQSVKAANLGIGATYTDANGTSQNVSTFASLDKLKSGGAYTNGVFVDGGADAIAQAIGVIDEALDEISTVRGELGAVESSTLQVQLNNLRVSYENLQAAESTIRDTDMTSEMANFTKYQIMMQAGTAMLAQANQSPNIILQLLAS